MKIDKEYEKYLKSDEWKKKREMRLKYDNYRCQNCGSTRNLEVHHTNYNNFYNESIKIDLITICRPCHNKRTSLDRKKRYTITDVS